MLMNDEVNTAPRTSSGRPLVLIADSHDDSRGMLGILLTAAGYDIAECDGGHGTVAHAQRLAPDVVLLSTSSWGDSIATVTALRSNRWTTGTHVILITGHGDPDYLQRAMDAGCHACLLKPVDVDQLIAELSRLTGNSARLTFASKLPRNTSADARRLVQDCCNSIESARAALERARTVSARAAKQVRRANNFLARVGHRPAKADFS